NVTGVQTCALPIWSAVLMCTAAKFGEPSAWLERAATVRADGTAAVADAVAARWVTPARAEREPELLASLRAMVVATPAEGYASDRKSTRLNSSHVSIS